MDVTAKDAGFGSSGISRAGSAATGQSSVEPVSRKRAADVLMLVTTFCWASNIIAGKEALRGFSPLALAQLRMLLAALCYGAMFLFWPNRPRLRLTPQQWLLLGLMAFTGITLNQICYLGGLARTSVTHTGLLQAVGPIMVLLLAAMIGREKLTIQNCAGMMIAFGGVAILLIGKAGAANGAHWSGDLFLLGAGAAFAFYTILMKDVADDYDPLTLSTLVFGLGAALLVPFSLRSIAAVEWQMVPLRAWAGLAYMVVFGSVVAYLIFAFALTVLSASKAAAFSYLQPVMAVALGVWLLGERITLQAVAGGFLILLGVYLTELQRARRRSVAKELQPVGIHRLQSNKAALRELYTDAQSEPVPPGCDAPCETNKGRQAIELVNHAWEDCSAQFGHKRPKPILGIKKRCARRACAAATSVPTVAPGEPHEQWKRQSSHGNFSSRFRGRSNSARAAFPRRSGR
ncbi:MAG: DMT family transporter [Acidobacteria bacterium]|nr:MAG: DMT family transporter [Acidobacteriota bacterium]